MNAIALLLAAGGSERMGAPKALLPWRGQPLLSHQLQQIRKSGVSECVVVLGTGADRLAPLVRPSFGQSGKTRSVINPRHESGKCSSVMAGLTSLPRRPDAILVISVDQPADHHLLDALLTAAEEEWERGSSNVVRTILVPTFEGRRGHPPLFSGALIGELMGIREETQGLKAVVRRRRERVLEMPWGNSEILLNLNSSLDLPPPGHDPARARIE